MIRVIIIGVICLVAYLFFKSCKQHLGIIDAEEKSDAAKLKNKELGIRACTAVQKQENRAMQEEIKSIEVEDDDRK